MKSNYSRWTLLRVGLNFLGLLLLTFAWYHTRNSKPQIKVAPILSQRPATLARLKTDYKAFNKLYFRSELPEDVVFDWTGDDGYRAVTQYKDGKFLVLFNIKYNASENDADMHLLHESCHIKNWDKIVEGQDVHGQYFQDCMHVLSARGAFEDIW